MSRRMKRLALLLSVTMAFTSVDGTVFATDIEIESGAEQNSEETETVEETAEDAVETAVEDSEEEIFTENTVGEEVSDESAEEIVLDAPEEEQYDGSVAEYAQIAEAEALEMPSEAEIGSIELVLEKSDFAADVESEFVSGAAITIKDTKGNVLEMGNISGDEFSGDVIDGMWLNFGTDNDWSMWDILPAGKYPVYANYEGKVYRTNAEITTRPLTEMNAPELKDGVATEITAYHNSRSSYNWYQFKPETSGMYKIAPCDDISIWTIDQEGKPEYVKPIYNEENYPCFYGKTGKTYYLGFSGTIESQEGDWTSQWKVTVSSYKASNPVTEISVVNAKKTADRIFEVDECVEVEIRYKTRDYEQTRNIYEEGYICDDDGHYFNCYLTDATGNKVSNFAAGEYIVHIEYVDNPEVNATYTLTMTEPDSTPLKLGESQSMSLGRETKLYSYVPEKTGSYVVSLTGEFGEDDESGLWIRGVEDSIPMWSNFDIEEEVELKAGIRYFFQIMRDDDVSRKFTITVREKEHSYVEETKAATCVSKGYTQRRCSLCGQIEEGSYRELPMTGHVYGAYVVTKQATALAGGVETRTCAICGHTDSRETAKLAGTIRLTTGNIPLQIKKSVQLGKVVTDLAAGDYIASCSSSAPAVATVDNGGKVTGKKAGKAEITIQLASGVTAKVKITVQKKAVSTSTIVTNTGKSWNAKIGEKKQLTVEIKPVSATDKVTYSSSNKKVATVSGKGLITAKKAGTAKITVKSGKKKYTITVKVAKAAPTDIKGVPSTKSLKKKKSFTIKAKLVPSGAEAKISYKSSNKKVATVNAKGKVTAKGSGTAVITVKAGNIQKTCTVTVK